MKAKEIFENEGYKLEKHSISGRYEYIEYSYEDGSYTRKIEFNPIMKRVKIRDTHDYSEFELTDDSGKIKQEVSLNIDELNAINQQMKEFGWIE